MGVRETESVVGWALPGLSVGRILEPASNVQGSRADLGTYMATISIL